ncbi:MAG TPA: four helix bundle protein [Gammaproteobacteria bacterium]|nr:four helix bundle protein [Gammaproteobacteria bacterium]
MAYWSFEDLEVWQRAVRLAVDVHRALRDSREWALKDQTLRSAISVASNIAEGIERDTAADAARFIHIAKGSAAELRTQVQIARRIQVIDEATARSMVDELRRISKMLHRLAHYLRTTPERG